MAAITLLIAGDQDLIRKSLGIVTGIVPEMTPGIEGVDIDMDMNMKEIDQVTAVLNAGEEGIFLKLFILWIWLMPLKQFMRRDDDYLRE